MLKLFCSECRKEREFLHIEEAIANTSASRSAMYNWMEREWVHWRELPNNRRVICKESLSHTPRGKRRRPDLPGVSH